MAAETGRAARRRLVERAGDDDTGGRDFADNETADPRRCPGGWRHGDVVATGPERAGSQSRGSA